MVKDAGGTGVMTLACTVVPTRTMALEAATFTNDVLNSV